MAWFLRTQLIDGSPKFPDFLSRNLAAANQDYTTKSAAAPATNLGADYRGVFCLTKFVNSACEIACEIF